MQSLVNAVRGAGASNVLMLGGVAYSNDLSQWLAHEPTDPLHNLAASWHSYNFNSCSSSYVLGLPGRAGASRRCR